MTPVIDSDSLLPATIRAGLLAGTPGTLQERKKVDTISYESAQQAIHAAVQKARELGIPCSIAVIDAGRDLVAFARLDGALLASVEVSIGKAFTARTMNMPSGDLQALTQPDAPFYGLETAISRPLISFAGGLPVTINDHVIGAIGVAGGSPDQDVEIASAAVSTLTS